MTDQEPDRSGADDRLDAELRRLFTDDRLTLPVRVDAERIVVAGARRRRRNRLTAAAATGVLGVAALVFVAASLAGVGRAPGSVGAASRPLLSTTLTTDPSSPAPAVRDDADVVGPTGVAGYRLGMSAGDVLRAGALRGSQVRKSAGVPPCVDYIVRGTLPAAGGLPTAPVATSAQTTVDVPSTPSTQAPSATYAKPVVVLSVLVAPKFGVVQVGGYGGLRTPEGIRTGMPEKRVYETYSTVKPTKDVTAAVAAPVPGNARALYVFDVDEQGTVTSVWVRQAGAFGCVP